MKTAVATTSAASTSTAAELAVPTTSQTTAAAHTSTSNSPGQPSTTRKNILSLKRMAYRREDYIDDEDDFVGTLGHLLPKRSKTVETIHHDSTLEILDGSFTNLRPIRDSALAHSTPIHRVEIISGNSSVRSVVPTHTTRNNTVSNLKESTRFNKNLATTLNSKLVEEMQCELDQSKTHFGSIRDRVSDVLEELDSEYGKRIEDLEENVESFDMLMRQIQVVRADRVKSIERMRLKREDYRKFSRIILHRLPSKFTLFQN